MFKGAFELGGSTSGGLMNPVLAMELWIWSAATYNQKDQPVLYPGQTQFTYLHYGRYVWIYILAPFAAAIVAGLLVFIHDGVSPPEKKEEVDLKK